jgi:hypothetical protein
MNPLLHLRWRLGTARERILNCLMTGRMDVVPGSWPLSPDVCPCDIHLCEYLQARDIRRSAIFHFGSGGHHLLGLRNRSDGLDNEILAITASPSEHARYVSQAVRDAAIGRHYRVLFGDIYELGPAALPTFDLATLFHLCEFTPSPAARRRLDDAGVLALLRSKVRVGGRLLFYGGSFAFARAAALTERAVEDGQLTFEERYKSLLVYRV